MRRVLILTGDAGEALEILYPKFRLEEEGWEVAIAAREKRPILTVVHDFEPGFDTYTEKPGYRVAADLTFSEVKPAEYDALVLPGGRAPEYLRNRPEVLEILGQFLKTGKPIAVTCHAPLILIAAGAVAGKSMACYPELATDLAVAQASFVDQPVVIDGPIISARAWPDNGPWMREFIRAVREREAVAKG
ncbi:DJ-1/PfpI family protein [Tundrisphaera sp. TA3]|uniref:DJ-1/PfpI family protein n=1 Tax=Tundrisphaera sp. TA3 TaxID=3435775 RepID=UPI003EB92F2E